VFGGYHKRELIEKGVTGFKLDECDNSDYIDSPWSFPELSKYPSGLDGERMHNLIGTLYQQTLYTPFREKGLRTYGQVRSSGALAAPLPYAIYSDLYEHKDYVRALINAGFTGLLWTPEVRSCSSEDELYRRLEVVVFSPQTMVNAWYIKNPPWKQFETEKNNRNEFLANTAEVEAACADILRWRVRLIPYLYAAFARYWQEGHPPFRGLMLDYPNDPNTYNIDDEYLMGESLLVAPLFAPQTKRSVYLPEGGWYNLWTRERFEGGKRYDIEADSRTIPVFVKENTLLPLAKPIEFVKKDTQFDVTVYAFGENCAPVSLFEDDGETFAFEKTGFNRLTLEWPKGGEPRATRDGSLDVRRYEVTGWIDALKDGVTLP
jgi:alpha-D-xyloside xylohydrolase